MPLKEKKKKKRKERREYQTHEGNIIFPFLTVDAVIAEGGWASIGSVTQQRRINTMCRKNLPQSVIFTAHRGLTCIETHSWRIETFVNAELGPHIAPFVLVPSLALPPPPSPSPTATVSLPDPLDLLSRLSLPGKPGVAPNAVCAASALTCYNADPACKQTFVRITHR